MTESRPPSSRAPGPRDADLRATGGLQQTGAQHRTKGLRQTGALRLEEHASSMAKGLDALITALGGDRDELLPVAEALLTRWRTHRGLSLQLDGDRLKTQNLFLLRAEGPLGRWILPATMAGLHSIQPRDEAVTEDLLNLAEILHGLTASAQGMNRLRELLWTEGLPGMLLEIGPAWSERLDLLPKTDGAREQLDRLRDEAVRKQTIAFASQAQRRDSTRQAQVLRYAKETRSGALALQPATSAALRNACDNGVFWTQQVGNLLRARPALAAGLNAQRLHHALVAIFDSGGDLRAVQTVATLRGEPDTLLGELQALVSPPALGRATGHSIPLDKRTLGQLIELFDQPPTDFSRGVARGLLERTAVDETTAQTMARFIPVLGLDRLWPHANLSGAPDTLTRQIARLLKALDANPSAWADLIAWSSPEVAAWILRHAPPVVLSRVEGNLRSLLKERSPQENAPLIQALAKQRSTSALRSLGEALLETKGEGWAGKVVPIICHALLKKRMGAQYLIPLFRDRSVDTKVRLLVLRTLEGEPELLAEASQFQVSELIEPPEIKERLKAARKRLKRMRQ